MWSRARVLENAHQDDQNTHKPLGPVHGPQEVSGAPELRQQRPCRAAAACDMHLDLSCPLLTLGWRLSLADTPQGAPPQTMGPSICLSQVMRETNSPSTFLSRSRNPR